MFRRKDGLYQEKIIINGKSKYFYGKTKKDVLNKIREYQEAEERGVNFEYVAAEWWEKHEKKIAYNTTKGYKPALKRAIEHFQGVPIKEIKPTQIACYIDSMVSQRYAQKTVNTQLTIFNLIFSYAVKTDYCLFNPARDLKTPKELPKKRIHIPPAEEIQMAKETILCTFGMFYYWLLYTGCRRGELLALTWEDVDIKNRVITINKSIYYKDSKPYIKKPKTKAGERTIPILDALMPYCRMKKKGVIFCETDGTYLTETHLKTLLKKHRKETGIKSTPHQFRHLYTVMLIEANMPPEEVQMILGHAQLSTTMDIYNEIREIRKEKIFNKMYQIDIV